MEIDFTPNAKRTKKLIDCLVRNRRKCYCIKVKALKTIGTKCESLGTSSDGCFSTVIVPNKRFC